MLIQRKQSGKYEAITNIKPMGVRLLNGVNIPVSMVGYGDTHFEALHNCLKKVRTFLANPKKVMDEDEAMDRIHYELLEEDKEELTDFLDF